MEKTTTNNFPANIEDLLNQMQAGKYKHLQIMLYRDKSSIGGGLGHEYLVVSRYGFGVYKLISLDYYNGIIQMILHNHFTEEPAEVTLNIANEHPDYFFVNWQDITNMVNEEKNSHQVYEDLLDLES